MINSIQDNGQLLSLALLGLRHLEHIQLVARQLLPQLVQHLAVIQVLFDVRHDDSLLDQLVVDPVDDGLEEIAHIWKVQALRLDDRALFVVVEIVVFWRDFGGVWLSRRVNCIFSFFLNVLD